jgi:hypothetical protein
MACCRSRIQQSRSAFFGYPGSSTANLVEAHRYLRIWPSLQWAPPFYHCCARYLLTPLAV